MGTGPRIQSSSSPEHTDFIGGARRDRTADLLHAMQALSQLSYGPTRGRRTLRSRSDVVKQMAGACARVSLRSLARKGAHPAAPIIIKLGTASGQVRATRNGRPKVDGLMRHVAAQ